MRLEQNFESTKYDDMIGAFDPLPAGDYLVRITETEIKITKAGTGKYIKIVMTVLAGDFKNRKIFSNINIQNPNETAVEIGQQELATLCRAVHVLQLQDTNQLHNIPFFVKVKIKRALGEYEASNRVVNYYAYEDSEHIDKTEAAPSGGIPSGKPPWETETPADSGKPLWETETPADSGKPPWETETPADKTEAAPSEEQPWENEEEDDIPF